jgi:hypothetical protein
MANVAAIGTDGLRPVVWGLGEDWEEAQADAQGYSDRLLRLVYVEVEEEQRARICAGEVDCASLGIELSAVQIKAIS